MDVVFHADDEERRAIELFGDAAEIRVERGARGFVAQERPAVFGGEDLRPQLDELHSLRQSFHSVGPERFEPGE